MPDKKREKERQWKARKESQHPHGKVASFAELADKKKQKSPKKSQVLELDICHKKNVKRLIIFINMVGIDAVDKIISFFLSGIVYQACSARIV